MNRIIITFSILVLSSVLTFAQKTEKLRRADCFFGVHFDLHASEDIADAGRTLTAEMIDTFLTKVKPDFIQIDCKGHSGISSYPTKVGYHVKGFQKDPLKLWREVTEKHRVGLFMHYSGVWDNKVCQEHPEWAIVKANGERSTQKTSFFSPYLDRILIPQMKELSRDYRVDGAWIDGECWAVEPDYSEAAIRAWKQKTGISEIPRTKEDHFYPQYIEFTRSLFREHVRKYVDAIHEFDPSFQVTSNWAYSSPMPEKVEIPLDFLSGDVTPQNGVFRSAFEARCLAPQGKPWDLMAWGFSWNGKDMPMSNKSAVQLKQEAAEIMAMGGGVQFYYQQNRDLSLKPWIANTLADIGSFCRERQPYCQKAVAVPQIALLFPTLSYQHKAATPYSPPTNQLQALLYALLDNQLPVEVLMEHHLSGKTSQYPLIVIPECEYIGPSLLNELRTYLQNGGKLLVVGASTASIFSKELGVKSGEKIAAKNIFLKAGNLLGSVNSQVLAVNLSEGSELISNFYDNNDFRTKSEKIAASVSKIGNGKIGAVYFDAGTAYFEHKTFVLRDFLAETLKSLSPELMVQVSGSHLVHVALNRLNDKLYVNLINVAGEHTNQSAIGYDQLPALGNLTVKLKTPKEPQQIILQPEGIEMKFSYSDGTTTVLIPRLEIHSILEVILEGRDRVMP